MHKRLVSFNQKHNILRHEQHGFQRGKSTTSACFELVNNVLENLDSGNLVTVVFFDMSKAFDFVSHTLLLNKLEKYGIRGPALSWFQSYVDEREQAVEITHIDKNKELNSNLSSFVFNNYGVPQGSVLGPPLFLMYINDLPDATLNPCIIFADDISLILTCKKNTDITKYNSDINHSIDSIIKWLTDNNLSVNLTKTKYIQFSTYNSRLPELNIFHGDTKIQRVEETTFLGFDIDRYLNWKSHVNKVCNKINRFVYVLYKLRKNSTRQTVLSAYHGYVSSVLNYGLIFWGNSTDVYRVFLTQKKCVRAMTGTPPWESCKPLFKELRILTLPCMYIFESAKFVKLNPDLFKTAKDIYPRNTRNPDRIVLSRIPRTALYAKNCQAMCGRIFNSVPNEIKELPSNMFVRKLKLWLIEKCYYSLSEFIK